MNQPIVSVLMTAFNREKYIGEAIESVLASSFKNFEIIIVDDASTDNTVTIATNYLSADNRIKLVVNKSNQGQFLNRNIAASHANGKYLKYIDSDDIIYPFSLQMMVDAMEAFPEAGLAFCLTQGPCKKPLPYIVYPEEALRQHFLEGGLLFCGPSGLLIRRDSFESVGGFEEFGMPSDNHLTLKIASRFPAVAVTRDLFWWRQHPQQVFSQNIGNHLNIFYNYAYSKNIIKYYACLSTYEKNLILKNQKKIFFLNVLSLAFKKGHFKKAAFLLSLFNKKNT
jgi:glycosyltransferase involved in cell wall biosynthesis